MVSQGLASSRAVLRFGLGRVRDQGGWVGVLDLRGLRYGVEFGHRWRGLQEERRRVIFGGPEIMLTSVWDELDNLGIGGGQTGVSRRWRLRPESGWEILRILGSGVRGRV